MRFGAKASDAVGTDRNSRQSAIARLRSTVRAEHADQQAGNRHAERARIGGEPDLRRLHAIDLARLGRIACVANRSTSVRKPITAISSELLQRQAPGGGSDRRLGEIGHCGSIAERVGVPPGAKAGRRDWPAEGVGAGAGTLLAVEHVRREQDGRHLAVVDPVMAEAVGLAADVAGLVLDRRAAGRAIFGDRAAQTCRSARADPCGCAAGRFRPAGRPAGGCAAGGRRRRFRCRGRSTPITVSVTPLGIVGALASALVPGVAHWPAIAGVAKLPAAATAIVAVASLVLRLNIAVSLNSMNLGVAKAGLQDARDIVRSRAPSAEVPAFATPHQNGGAARARRKSQGRMDSMHETHFRPRPDLGDPKRSTT